jgi:hypothetical protein
MRKISLLLTLGIVLAAAMAFVGHASAATSQAAALREIVLHKSGIIISQGNASKPAPDLSRSTAFQWGDASIGAGFALGLTALASGGMLLVRRRRGGLKTS